MQQSLITQYFSTQIRPLDSQSLNSNNIISHIQILKYMGNKRKLLSWLVPILDKQLKSGDTLLDLFAGTSSVGYALKPKVRVIANDIQAYSSTISSALLEFNNQTDRSDFERYLYSPYTKNLNYLLKIFKKAVQVENKSIFTNNLIRYQRYCLSVPKYGEPVKNDRYNLNAYSEERYIKYKRAKKNSFPYILFSIFYPNTFFSLQQCLEIDSLRFAIDQTSNRQKKAVYLSCLMYAISKAVNSSGHFAEYLNHHSDFSSTLIMRQRKVSIKNQFLIKLNEFSKIIIQNKWINEVYNLDYKVLIDRLYKNKKLNEVNLIYIDPPYTEAQYSRYYHIPETLVKYDYPILTQSKFKVGPTKGRYRNDRHQSTFSQLTKAEEAFREMFEILSSRTNAKLAISYSNNSILKPIERLINLAKKHYKIIDTKNGYIHSAQGSKFNSNGKGSREIHEYLLICTPKKS